MRIIDNDSISETKWADIEADEDYDESISAHNLLGFESAADSQGYDHLRFNPTLLYHISLSTRHGGLSIYLSLKSKATPRDRGSGEDSHWTSGGIPGSDLRELEGEVNRRAVCKRKITKRVKEIRIKKLTNRAVFNRKDLRPFNLNEDNDTGVVIVSNEDIMIEVPKGNRRFQEDDFECIYMPPDTNLLRLTRELKMKFKSLKDDDDTVDEIDEKETTAKYVPPSRKDGDRRSFEEFTIRITNLSEDVKEKDLTDLFGTIGRIHRAYLAKHKETQSSKGFAFITYTNKEDALNAINKFNRWGYNNLLLNVEWARPPARDR